MRYLVLLLLVGCAHVGVTEVKSAPARAEGCELKVFVSEKEAPPHDTLCMIDARTGTSAFADRSVAGAIAEAKPYACKCGADAVVVMDSRQEGMTLTTNGQGFVTVKAVRLNH